MEPAPKVVLDFRADYRTITDKVLAAHGITSDPGEPYGAAVYRYFAAFHRRVEARPYRKAVSNMKSVPKCDNVVSKQSDSYRQMFRCSDVPMFDAVLDTDARLAVLIQETEV